MEALKRLPRFLWSRITIPSECGECWIWLRGIAPNGYGQITIKRVPYLAHRLVYETAVGPIPSGLELDHLCRVRRCVNPNHLEPVTHLENMLRGAGLVAIAAAKTHCPQGHPLAHPNLHPSFLRRGHRRCLICHKEQCRAAAARQHQREKASRL